MQGILKSTFSHTHFSDPGCHSLPSSSLFFFLVFLNQFIINHITRKKNNTIIKESNKYCIGSLQYIFFCTTTKLSLWWLNKCNSHLFHKVSMSDTQWWSDVSLIVTAGRKQKNRKYHRQNLKWLRDLQHTEVLNVIRY